MCCAVLCCWVGLGWVGLGWVGFLFLVISLRIFQISPEHVITQESRDYFGWFWVNHRRCFTTLYHSRIARVITQFTIFLYIYYNTSMLRLMHIFFYYTVFVCCCWFSCFKCICNFSSPSPSPLNCMTNLRNERNHIFERTFPSFKPNVIFTFVVTSTISIFLLFRIFLHMYHSECITLHLQQT